MYLFISYLFCVFCFMYYCCFYFFIEINYLSQTRLTFNEVIRYIFQAYVYEGKTGDLLGELGSPAHKGGIYAVSINIL